MYRFFPVSSLLIVLMMGIQGCRSTPTNYGSLKLYVFDCGRLRYDSLDFLGIADNETHVRELVAPCFVIEHEAGRLLWEGGLPSTLAKSEGWQEMEGGWSMRLDSSLEQQLTELGLSMNSFDYAAFSHFHMDHVGVANEVQGATLIIPRREHDVAFSDSAAALGYAPELYGNLKQGRPLVIEGEHDVFGDGRVRLVPAPGHTAGHQVLYVDLSEEVSLILGGDLYVFRVGREKRRVLPIDADTIQSRRSMVRIDSMIEETGATLWIGHELARYLEAEKPPRYQN